ncbi:hypothetical protein J2Z21_005969 [Streptomyces griseochromogenes]|uniref:DUF1877 domain-containing protein n=1 Tax=Streptomyces griseochromogenes TaxID=68214 RepID=A0A1B1AP59_9ACTN|nr:DUF1877 family protein [Streptomyces griseochromogenes]ANP48368.1 DUF1877 domain-containing protein [Streptomyces griseochromogenes]MBP2052980.1 hypothetical protein [Streptomyces griseochromogenes]
MSTYLRMRAVPAPALRNSATWLERQFEDDVKAVRHSCGRHREEVLDERYLDQERIYAGALPHGAGGEPRAQVVLGGRPVCRTGRAGPRLLVLTAAQARRVAGFLSAADFDALWDFARGELLPRYGGVSAEPETWGAFAAAHRELRAFYARTAESGDAVVKWLPV